MKLYHSVLTKFIDLAEKDPKSIRGLLDDLGLEVKDIEQGPPLTFTIETLANRGDHLHALGIAREISARLLKPITSPSFAASLPSASTSVKVEILTQACLGYALLELKLDPSLPATQEMTDVLQGKNYSDKNVILQYLDYIFIEMGQPMHAFDQAKVEGNIVVALAEKTEEVLALDGKKYLVPPESIVIRDQQKIIAVAGVIGCANSMVSSSTSQILIESASFDPVSVRKTSRAMGIVTDASHFFERGCDIEASKLALRRLIGLFEESLAKSKVEVKGSFYISSISTKPRVVILDLDRLRNQIQLYDLSQTEVVQRFEKLGYGCQVTDGKLSLQVPSWRVWDVFDEQDLIEDFAKVSGLNLIPLTLPPFDFSAKYKNDFENLLRQVEVPLIANGFFEVMTNGFLSQQEVGSLIDLDPDLNQGLISVQNAVDSKNSHLKNTNILHLASLAERNHRKGVLSVKVYETCRLFSKDHCWNKQYQYEREVLTLAASGRWFEHEWRKAESKDEFIKYFKGTIEAIFASVNLPVEVVNSNNKLFHPGWQGILQANTTNCGVFGLVHPTLVRALDLRHEMFYCEIDLDCLQKFKLDGGYVEQSEQPAVKRDLTIKIPQRTLAAVGVNYIKEAKLKHLIDVIIVDSFHKTQEVFNRVSYRLTFQENERTLEAEEVDIEMQKLFTYLKNEYAIEIEG